MKKNTLFIIVLIISTVSFSQEKKKSSAPIIFTDLTFSKNISAFNLYYQYKKNLFSFRVLQKGGRPIYFPFGEPERPYETFGEVGVLYGKRIIYNGSSLSFSGGISSNTSTSFLINTDYTTNEIVNNYIGFPFEINFRWFKAKKSPFMLYYFIPVSKPTSFGRNIGFKLIGNLSKNSFIGIGFTYGLGVHKKY